MPKKKYYYNHATCSYEPVRISVVTFLMRSFVFLIAAFGLAIGIAKYYNGRFISPKEAELLEDNAKLKSYYQVIQEKLDKSISLLAVLQERDDTLYRVLLNTSPLSPAERNAGIGGVDKYAHLGKETLIAQTLSKVDRLANKLTIQKKSFDYLLSVARKTASRLKSIPTLPPLSKKHLKRISAPFGMRLHPIYKIHKLHPGVDFAAPLGTPIYAAADGYIKSVKSSKKSYGNHMLIEHGHGYKTLYAHMHKIIVREQQKVVRGQQIGTVGNTGDSTAPHLHYAVYSNGNLVDPMQYFAGELTPEEYEDVRKQAAGQTQALCSNF
ncbi:MAG: peptidoglycan DD-metalloendopeptidase family protein [Amoebophilaceae bacterium]|nr:peptidoglycan DD-metalloendopeptidase family protein [Amoebophilaceae bacterium]